MQFKFTSIVLAALIATAAASNSEYLQIQDDRRA